MVGRATIKLRPHDLVRVGLTVHILERQPFNLCTPQGVYHRAYVRAGDIWHARSLFTTPPFERKRQVTHTGKESEPRILYDLSRGAERLYLWWTHAKNDDGSQSDVQSSWTDTDGDDWSAPAVAIAGGKHPFPVAGPGGEVYVVAYVGGILRATEQQPGDLSPSAQFTLMGPAGAPLKVADDSFGICWLHEHSERPELAVVLDGETTVSEHVSGDDMRTWERKP